MRNRLRLGAAAAIGLGALLLATVLASPALAWHSNVDVKAECHNNQVRVSYTVTAWEKDHEADVEVFSKINGEVKQRDSGSFGPGKNQFYGQFDLDLGTTGEVTIIAVAHWKGGEESTDKGSAWLPKPDKCEKPTTSTAPPTTAPPTTAPPTTAPPTTAPPTTTPPSSSVSPTTSVEETTTSAAVGAATSTTSGGGQLPFTGNSSGPMLLAGIVLVGGGSLFLLISRARDGHATK
jgi:hypothetical protein